MEGGALAGSSRLDQKMAVSNRELRSILSALLQTAVRRTTTARPPVRPPDELERALERSGEERALLE